MSGVLEGQHDHRGIWRKVRKERESKQRSKKEHGLSEVQGKMPPAWR